MSKHKYDFTEQVPEGFIYVCGACGKRALTRAGFDENNKSTAIDHGYDESCFLNASLVKIPNTKDSSWCSKNDQQK